MKRFLLQLLCAVISTAANAQQICGTDELHHQLLQTNKAYAEFTRQRLEKDAFSRPLREPLAIPDTIPVVVHIVHTGTPVGSVNNPHDSIIHNLIRDLNQQFNATYPGHPTINTGGVDVGMHFTLAQTSPNCTSTNGIVRVNASNDIRYVNEGVWGGFGGPSGISQEDLALKSFWDNTRYFNIWIVNRVTNYAAYAYFPPVLGVSSYYDGIVIGAPVIDYPGLVGHEAGHYFSLFHTFEGTYNNNCPLNTDCNIYGDYICDTPPALVGVSCNPTDINPCTNQPVGNAGLNYMSYSCYRMFTPMQKARMRNTLDNYRTTLLFSNTELPPPALPSVSIMSNDTDNIICRNQPVTFSASITGNAQVTTYKWFKNSALVSTNSFYQTDSLLNNDTIICKITASAQPCYANVSVTSNSIIVTVPHLNPVITRSNLELNVIPTGESNYSWSLNNQAISNTDSSIFPFSTFGSYTVTEIYKTCSATSPAFIISPFESRNNEISIYPNPFNGLIYAQTSLPEITIQTLRVFSVDGKLLESKKFNNANIIEWDGKKMPAANYILEFTTNKGVKSLIVTKQN